MLFDDPTDERLPDEELARRQALAHIQSLAGGNRPFTPSGGFNGLGGLLNSGAISISPKPPPIPLLDEGDRLPVDEATRQGAAALLANSAGGKYSLDQFNQWVGRPNTMQEVQRHWAATADPNIGPPLPSPSPQAPVGPSEWWKNLDQNPMYSKSDLASIISGAGGMGGDEPNINVGSAKDYAAGPFSGVIPPNRYAMPVTDSFMSRDPVHILGVNGFRTGSSSPMVDYSGPAQRDAIAQQQMGLQRLFSSEDAHAADQATKMAMFMGTLGNKGQQARDRSLMMIGNAKVPASVAQAEIDNMIQRGEIDKPTGENMMLERHLSIPDQHGQMQPIGPDAKTGNMFNVLSRVPPDASPDIVKNFLMENRGVTIDQVKKRYRELLEEGSSRQWSPMNPSSWLQKDPGTFKKDNLSEKSKVEFDAISRIFGRK